MEWTVDAIREELRAKPELLELVTVIQSFPKERQPAAYRLAAYYLTIRKMLPHDKRQ